MSQGLSFNDLVEEAKRKSLKDLPPAIPMYKTTDDSIPKETAHAVPKKPKKPIFGRYDTYIACPGCGSLVPKGAKQCECGYDLSGLTARIGRCLRRAVPILLCILLIICGTAIGYYAGQMSMDSELEKQYNLGYESGHDIGYESGKHDGYVSGHQDGYKSGYSVAKKEYSAPNPFSNSSSLPKPQVSWQK